MLGLWCMDFEKEIFAQDVQTVTLREGHCVKQAILKAWSSNVSRVKDDMAKVIKYVQMKVGKLL